MPAETRVDKIKKWFENNRITSIIIIVVAAIIGLGAFTEALHKIKDFFFIAGGGHEFSASLKRDSIRIMVEPIVIKPIEAVEKKIATFKLSGPDPRVSLKFVADKAHIVMDFKASKKMKCAALCDAIVNHFELLKSIQVSDAGISIKPSLVINSYYVPFGEQTLEDQGVKDGDILQISYDFSGKTFASVEPLIWNDTLVHVWASDRYTTGNEVMKTLYIISAEWEMKELFMHEGDGFKKQDLYLFNDAKETTFEQKTPKRKIDGKEIEDFGVF